MSDERRREPFEEATERIRGQRTVGRDHPAVCAGDGEGQRGAAPRTRIVRQQRHPDSRLGPEPGLQTRDFVLAADLDPSRVDDRGRERRGQILRSGRQIVGIAA